MVQANHPGGSRFPVAELKDMSEDIQIPILEVQEKSGFIPNVFLTLAHRPDEFRTFFAYHDALMEKPGNLSKAEREMIVHCIADHQSVNNTFVADIGLAADPVDFMNQLMCNEPIQEDDIERASWSNKLRRVQDVAARWPVSSGQDEIPFTTVVRELEAQSPENLVICLDTGTFTSSVYKHFSFGGNQRLIASQSGAMGYAIPAATIAQMRFRNAKVVCLVGDGGFLMTGNEIIAAVERQLPILFIISNNNCYGSIRVHQNQFYPDRNIGTSLTNPDFVALARAFGAQAELVDNEQQIKDAIARGLCATGPYGIEVKTSLEAALNQSSSIGSASEMA